MAPRASFRFYGALNDFLAPSTRQATLVCDFASGASVKDLIEALGVPHVEVDRVVANGAPVDFAYIVRDGDRLAVYPPFRNVDLGPTARLGPPPQTDPRFVADVHLGRLAAYLRLAGFDTKYRNDYSDRELVAISASEDRTLITRDIAMLKYGILRRGCFVRETRPARQLVEMLDRFDLVAVAAPFTRCLRCNTVLRVVPKDRVERLLPPRSRERYTDFSQCPSCARVYWQGSHYAQLSVFLEAAFDAARMRTVSARSTS